MNGAEDPKVIEGEPLTSDWSEAQETFNLRVDAPDRLRPLSGSRAPERDGGCLDLKLFDRNVLECSGVSWVAVRGVLVRGRVGDDIRECNITDRGPP